MILKNLIFVGGGSWWTCMQYSYYHITFQLRFTFYNILQCNLLYDCFLSPFHPVFDGRQWDARTGMNTALGGRKGAFSAWHGLPPNVAISPENYLSIFMKIPGLNHNTRCWIDFGMIICIFICIYIYILYTHLLVIYWLSTGYHPSDSQKKQTGSNWTLDDCHTLASSTPRNGFERTCSLRWFTKKVGRSWNCGINEANGTNI